MILFLPCATRLEAIALAQISATLVPAHVPWNAERDGESDASPSESLPRRFDSPREEHSLRIFSTRSGPATGGVMRFPRTPPGGVTMWNESCAPHPGNVPMARFRTLKLWWLGTSRYQEPETSPNKQVFWHTKRQRLSQIRS